MGRARCRRLRRKLDAERLVSTRPGPFARDRMLDRFTSVECANYFADSGYASA